MNFLKNTAKTAWKASGWGHQDDHKVNVGHNNNIWDGMDNNDDIKYQESDYARCFIESTISGGNKPKLLLDKRACDVISKKFEHIISLVGLAGNGKSTLASTIYNIMRNDKYDYFEMSDGIASMTQGVWCLKNNISDKDILNILDLQGLENANTVHYMVIVNTRFDFSILDTLAAGFDLMDKFRISLPKPVIYIQVPFKQLEKNSFRLRKETVDKEGLIKFAVEKCPALKDYDIRLFGLPKFYDEEYMPEGTRFDKKYVNQVKLLIDELKNIDEGPRAKERIRYAVTVAKALNSDSPQLVAQLNFVSFKEELELIRKNIDTLLKVGLQQKYEALQLKKKISKKEFVEQVDYIGEMNRYKEEIINQAKNLAYYDNESKQCEELLNSIINNNNLFENPMNYISLYYEQAMERVRLANIAEGKKLMKTQNEALEAFVNTEISKRIYKIPFKGSTYMPYDLDYKVKDQKASYIAKLMQATQDDAEIPDGYLEINVELRWNTAVEGLKSQWNFQISRAKSKRYEVRSSGGSRCTQCGNQHNEFVGHKECRKNSDDSRWLWVDPPTKYAVCDSCNNLQRITYVCCWNCNASLPTSLRPPPSNI